jgi:hypothetical protein
MIPERSAKKSKKLICTCIVYIQKIIIIICHAQVRDYVSVALLYILEIDMGAHFANGGKKLQLHGNDKIQDG